MGGKRVFYVAERMQFTQYKIRIRQSRGDDREVFYYDDRTKTIRLQKDSRFVLSFESGNMGRGRGLVVRPFRGKNDQRFFFRNYHFHNVQNKNLCADISAFKDEQDTPVIGWTCHDGINQKFVIEYESDRQVNFQFSGLKEGQKFMIKTYNNKYLFQYYLRSRVKKHDWHYFFYDGVNNLVRWQGNINSHFAVHRAVAGAKVFFRSFNPRNVRDHDKFYFDSRDGKFHSFMRDDLCIHFNHPNRNGERMILQKCSSRLDHHQRMTIEYFNYGRSNGFFPWRVFQLKSKKNQQITIKIGVDGHLLYPK